MTIASITEALGLAGLCLLGGFRPGADDMVPPVARGVPAATVLMVGNAGPAMWRAFTADRPPGPAPLDAWTRAAVAPVAARFGARAVFAFDRPFLPFQRWAIRTGACHASPIMLLVHPRFGLWHALRAAVLLPQAIDLPPSDAASPCEACRDKPCLHACPVGAFAESGFDAAACTAHLAAPAGADCKALACRARRACPVGASFRYEPDQARFHMAAFAARD